MRLSAIRLAGFKSFVDRTQLTLASNLTAVVGPNGCGKSNLIDAVRWVLGESSARQLRGEALSDVIFNGSKTRKPVGRAMIELVFDNSDGTISGPYASYAEISVRRELSREGQSLFFINGTRCRRKDITELFLGTGLGGRSSYAIIEQGTVSRLIEAQPDELRQMLEETAGISRYKEKRRETEHRIRHTRENLSRLEDLLSEIDERLAKLQRQAAAANRYKQYREEQRKRRRQLFGLRFRALDGEAEAAGNRVAFTQSAMNDAEKGLKAAIEQRDQGGRDAEAAAEALSQVQADFYAAEADLARRDQERKHAADMLSVREAELGSLVAEAERLVEKRSEQEQRIAALTEQLAVLESELSGSADTQGSVEERMRAAETQVQEQAEKLQAVRRELDQPRTVMASERVRLEQLARQIERATQRRDRAAQALERVDLEALQAELDSTASELKQADAAVESADDNAKTTRERVQALREARVRADGELHEARKAAQALHARVATLQAEQARALGEDDARQQAWLAEHGWGDCPQLGRSITVEQGWEGAVESVLGPWLLASCVPDDPAGLQLGDADGVALVQAAESELDVPADSLAARVSGPRAARELLLGITVADDAAQAARILAKGEPGTAVVTPDGTLRLAGAARVDARGSGEDGVLLRERLLAEITAEEAAAQKHVAALQKAQESCAADLHAAEEDQQKLFAAVNEARQNQARLRSRVDALTQKLEAERERQRQNQAEHAEAEELATGLKAEKESAEKAQGEATRTVAELETRERAEASRLDELRAALQAVRDEQAGMRKELEAKRDARLTVAADLAAARAGLDGLGNRAEQIAQARAAADAGLAALAEPLPRLKAQMEEARQRRDAAGEKLKAARARQDEINRAAQAKASAVLEAEQVVQQQREQVQEARFAQQRLEARRESLEEQLRESGASLDEVLAELDDELTLPACEEELERLDSRIQRLGAVNLAAVEEYDEESKRAEELRAQEADLLEALAKLEDAIGQIDKETRARFKTTYETVNEKFKTRFPRLFGGGEAYLELTGDDILEAGVRVMARPPGKRNASIQLLSGGEKAMTAVALVFALFELNPAPFCLLDEVDAPLDDANVVRFCDVVREMSSQVQFIVVTHNKVTMELAEQLNGVTMQEAGVSRLVSVDVQQAVAMTE